MHTRANVGSISCPGRLPIAALACLLWLAASTAAWAQALDPAKRLTQYNLDNWSQVNGLPQNTVAAIQQTHDGHIWLATYQGLVRFDGVGFRTYDASNTPQIRVNAMRALLLDTDSTLWVGTGGEGLLAYKDRRFKRYGAEEGLPVGAIWSLMTDKKGNLWIGTDRGLVVRQDGKFIDYGSEAGVVGETLVNLTQDSLGRIWMGTRTGLFRFDGQIAPGSTGQQRAGKHWPELGTNALAVHRDRNGQLWVGTDKGVFRLFGDRFQPLLAPGGPGQQQITEIFEDSRGTVWIGTLKGGLFRYRNGNCDNLSRANGLDDNQVESFFEDLEGSLWFGSYLAGLYRLRDAKFTNYGAPEGLSGDGTYCVLEDTIGTVWVGTSTGGLNRYRNGQFSNITEKDGLSGNYVRTLHQETDGTLWVGTYGQGVTRIQQGRYTRYSTKQGLVDNFVRGIYPAHGGGLWIVTRNGLSRFDKGKFQNFGTESGLQVASVIALTYDGIGNLWVGTEGAGLYMMPADTFGRFRHVPGIDGDVVLSLRYDPEYDCLWAGTTTGLNYIKDGRFTAYTKENGEFAQSVTTILQDDLGSLWLGSNDGVYRISKKQLLDFAEGRIKRFSATHYGLKDGMRSGACLPGGFPGGFKTRDGRLWLPTGKGVSVVDPSNLPTNSISPAMAIHAVLVGDSTYEGTSQVRFHATRDPIEIRYAALTFISPENVRLKYRLVGFDRDWVEAGARRVAYYTNLPSGTYTFEVLGANADGVWAVTPATISIRVLSPWYATWWAYLIYLGLLGGAIYLIVVVRSGQLLRDRERLATIVEERTRELTGKNGELQAAYEEIRVQMDNLEAANREVEAAYQDIERQNQNVNDSLAYARRIQEAILPNLAMVQTALPKSFVLYEPRDIVSGDFYWFSRKTDIILLAVVDCTGHGVPGAFMSVMGNALLNQLVNERKLRQPAEILYHLNTAVQNNLHQYDPNSTSLDGMEISLVAINPLGMHLSFAGANQSLYRLRNNTLDEVKGDRFPIGGGQYGIRTFTQHEFEIDLGDTFYLFTDGIADQFGGPKSRKFSYNRLQSLLRQIQILSMKEQQSQIAHTLEAWRGDLKQVDDQLIIGFRF